MNTRSVSQSQVRSRPDATFWHLVRKLLSKTTLFGIVAAAGIILAATACSGGDFWASSAAGSGLSAGERECLFSIVGWSADALPYSPLVNLVQSDTRRPAAKFVRLPDSELADITSLMAQKRYQGVHQTLSLLSAEYPTTPEIYYLDMKAYALEILSASTMPPGEQRCEITARALFEDYLGLICAGSEAYLSLYDSSSPYSAAVESLHRLADNALGARPCQYQPVESYDLDVFMERLPSNADFMEALRAFTFEW